MIRKVTRICFFLSLIFTVSCIYQKKNFENLREITDSKDSLTALARISSIKKLDDIYFKAGTFSNKEISVNYRLLEPKNIKASKKYPLVLVFHGSGATGTDNTSQMGVLSKMWLLPEHRENHQVFVLAPQFPIRSSNYHLNKNRNILVSESNEYLDLVLKSVDSLSQSRNIDPDRIYAMGFSMGGATVMNALSKRPDLFAAAINISGIADFSNLPGIKNIPLWIIHGALDTENRPESNRSFYNEMKHYGHVNFWNYKNKYHNNILSGELVNEIPKWILQQKKKK